MIRTKTEGTIIRKSLNSKDLYVRTATFAFHLLDMNSFSIRYKPTRATRQCDYDNRKYQPDTKSNPNPNPNPEPTTKQHAIVKMQLNIATCPIRIQMNSHETMLLHRFYKLRLSLLSHCRTPYAHFQYLCTFVYLYTQAINLFNLAQLYCVKST